MSVVISCEVAVDGTRLADTAVEYLGAVPTALDGFSMSWGRDGPASQPDLPSCSLTVADLDGDAEFLGLLHVGATLEVTAATVVTLEGDSTDVVQDGTFDTPLVDRVGGRDLTFTDDPAQDVDGGGHAVKATATVTPGNYRAVYLPPAPYETAPGGWSDIPTLDPPGSPEWSATVQVRSGPIPMGIYWQLTGFADSLKTSSMVAIGDQMPIAAEPAAYVLAGGPVAGTVAAPCWLGITIGGVAKPAYTSAPADMTYDDTIGTGSYADCDSVWLDDMHVLAPPVTTRRANVFAGRITDLTASADGDRGVRVAITASDWAADLANQNIGDTPWLKETLGARANRIAAKATAPAPTMFVDPRPRALNVSWLDVDNQGLYGLLSDLATSGDGILWPLAKGELWIEDPNTRASIGTLDMNASSGLVDITYTRPTGGVTLDACDVLRDDLELVQTVEDVVTRVAATWLDQTLDETGNPAPTDMTVYVDDAAAQATLGVRELSVSTLLTLESDATTIAGAVLARSSAGAWHATGLVWDTRIPVDSSADDQLAALELLDMHARAGLLVTVTDVPAWVPLGPDLSAFLEGGTYRYELGRWVLELGLAPSGVSGASCTYADLDPAWTHALFDPAVRYVDLWGIDSAYT